VVVCKLTNTTDCTITPTATSNAVNVIKSPMVSPFVSITTSALATGTVCEGSSVTFSATVVNGDLSNTAYQWKVNGINTGTNSSLFTTNDYNNGDLVTCSIITSGKCLITTANSNQIALSVIPNVVPIVSISPSSDYPVCLNTPVTFAAGSPNAGVNPNYQWQVNGNAAGTNSLTFTRSTLANGDEITCIISNPASCVVPVTSNMITFSSLPLPTIVFNSSPVTVKLGESVILNPAITGNIATYGWSPALGLSNINAEHPVAKPSVTTTYTLLITSASGCTGTASVTINVINPVIIPSTFTPNGDSVNDIWSIPSLVGYPGCTVNVFNRYGTQLFKSVGYAVAWDGTYKNSPLPAGTYYYIVDPKNGLRKISGYVVILR
jgi:gliding motility-associated-like protein